MNIGHSLILLGCIFEFHPKINHGGGVEGGGGIRVFVKVLILLIQNFKIVAFFLLGYFWLNLKFIPKYTILGGEGRLFDRFQIIFLVIQEAMQFHRLPVSCLKCYHIRGGSGFFYR